MADYIDPKDEFYKNYFLNLAKSGQLDKPSITSNELSESNDYKVPVAEGDVLKKLEPYFEKAGTAIEPYLSNYAVPAIVGLGSAGDALLAHMPSTAAKGIDAALSPGEESYSEKYKKAADLLEKRKQKFLEQTGTEASSNIGNIAGSLAGMGKFGKLAQSIGGGSNLAHSVGGIGYGGLQKAAESKELEEIPSKFLEGVEDYAKWDALFKGGSLSLKKLNELYKNPATRKLILGTLGLSAGMSGSDLSEESKKE